MNTSQEELKNFLKLLGKEPTFIPIRANDKRPDITEGESWKDPKNFLNSIQAIERLEKGQNVGVIAKDWLVIVDLDKPEKYMLPQKTLTVETRNGSIHKYFLNAGDVENSVGKNSLAKCGEVRAEWQYVLSAGSYVPPDPDSKGTGLYHIIEAISPTILKKTDLPADFQPIEGIEEEPQKLEKPLPVRNCYGWELEEIVKRDQKLDTLLKNTDDNYPSASEADMATLTKLLFWGFNESEAVNILKKYRGRPKLERGKYIATTLSHILLKTRISDLVNPKKWNPTTGYKIELNFGEQPTSEKSDDTNIIEELMNKFTFKTPTDLEDVHFYQDGLYIPAEHMIKTFLEEKLGDKATTHLVNEILDHIRRRSYVERSTFNNFKGSIPVRNGYLNLETGDCQPFNSEQIFTYKLNASYDKTVDCPKFKQWLSEVQTPDNIKILQEYAGYSLLPEMPYHKSIWFIGEGRNGKTTYITTLEKILGEQNCEYVSIQQLNGERNFAEAQLYGKLINVSSEPTTRRELETPLFKKLIGNDYISAEVKCKQRRLNFRNIAKFYILGNQYPRVRDHTTAFKERIIIVKWERQFIEGKNQIQEIEKNWLNDPQERSGILNWMIEGLQRLRGNHQFTNTRTQQETMIEFERASDSIAAWIDERLIFDPKLYVSRDATFDDYLTYCEDFGLPATDKTRLFNRIRNNTKVRDSRSREDGKETRVWRGIGLKEPRENFEDTQDTKLDGF